MGEASFQFPCRKRRLVLAYSQRYAAHYATNLIVWGASSRTWLPIRQALCNQTGSPQVNKRILPPANKVRTVKSVITAADLNIRLGAADDPALFKWLVASFLMGKRIQSDIAAEAYRVIVQKHRCDTPSKLAACSHRELVRMLGEARYTRYDESTAERLLKLSRRLNDEYGGKVTNIRQASDDCPAFETRLKAFEGIGPKTVEIFLRDARGVLF